MDTRSRVEELIAWSAQGRFDEAYREFYAPDVIMQENNEPPRTNVQASIDRQNEAVSQLGELHEFRAVTHLVDGDRAVIEWKLAATLKDGSRWERDELALQTWKDGKIVHERFFYDPANAA